MHRNVTVCCKRLGSGGGCGDSIRMSHASVVAGDFRFFLLKQLFDAKSQQRDGDHGDQSNEYVAFDAHKVPRHSGNHRIIIFSHAEIVTNDIALGTNS
jgi:hypothetical protein